MAKIAYNACYGGFGLSEQGVRRYAELKGLPVYVERKNSLLATYWTVPPDERVGIISGDGWHSSSLDERHESNRLYRQMTINASEFDRADPLLIQVIEELGPVADGEFAKLKIEEVPAGTLYRIDEYDGNESVMTNGDYEWIIAQ